MKRFYSLYASGFVLVQSLFSGLLPAQTSFARADSLRGTLSPLRSCYDVKEYELELTVLYPEKSIEGSNRIVFSVLDTMSEMQIDLFENMQISSIYLEDWKAEFRREGNAVFVMLPRILLPDEFGSLDVNYKGIPIAAKQPPWDGGFVWRTDPGRSPWIGVACEGIGASLWWPLKDHLSDEPDSMSIAIRLPLGPLNKLMAVANGQLRSEKYDEDSNHVFRWAVTYPINSYNVTLNIGDYVQIHDEFVNSGGKLDLDYYVLRNNEAAARKHFQQVSPMIECFEEYFGEYPFRRDGYALVETDYWGMEHQGAIAYGNKYSNNNWGFDYIVIHESGHEWWGNHVSTDDHAELWIHESFCTYSESIYMECLYGKEKALDYLKSQKWGIQNKKPIVGPRDVNFENWGDSDMYYKGAWFLHTLRNVIRNDSLWFAVLKKMQSEFGMKTTTTAEVISFFHRETKMDLSKIFRQYLYHPEPPKLEYSLAKKGKQITMKYRWKTDVDGFEMNVGIVTSNKGAKVMLDATNEWQTVTFPGVEEEVRVDTDYFYVSGIQD